MGPPELPGGNFVIWVVWTRRTSSLQWGRRNYPAETPGRTRTCAPTALRFNGAAGITRRKPTGAPASPTSGSTLQWGRRNYPAETDGVTMIDRPTNYPLQWGRRNYPAETAARSPGFGSPWRGFNGAAGITRRKPGGFHTPTLAYDRFNGAAGITRRKLRRSGWRAPRHRASMGPPELPGGNATMTNWPASGGALQWGRRNYPAETYGLLLNKDFH